MRIMLDTNILVSAFILKSSKINNLIKKLSIEHEIVICSYTINELKELINTKFNVSSVVLDNFFIKFPFTLIDSPIIVDKKLFDIRDENDYIILHTAIINDIDIFITGDKDFKDVTITKPIILTPSKFLERF